jgi:hypothetical protein
VGESAPEGGARGSLRDEPASPPRPWRRRAAAGGAVSLSLAALAAAPLAGTASCDGTECQSTPVVLGCDVSDAAPSAECCSQGQMVNIEGGWYWETVSQNADWIYFPPSNTITIHLGAWTDANPEEAVSQIQLAPYQGPQNPDMPASSADAATSYFSAGTGSLGEWANLNPGIAIAENGTCSPYWARIVIGFDTPHGAPLQHGPCWKE